MPFMDAFINMKESEFAGSPAKGDNYVTPSKAKGAYMQKITRWKDIVIKKFYNNGIDLNKSIAEIASEEGLNQDQLSRLIEEVNCEVYLDEYNKTKNSSVRDVRFNIAKLSTIKDLMNPEDAQELESSQENKGKKPVKGGKGMMKKAFEHSDGDEPLNVFNYTAFEHCGLAPEADKDIDPRVFSLKKLAKQMVELENDIEKTAKSLYEDYSDLANAFIKMAQQNEDIQSAFATMCKEASFESNYQDALLDLFNEKVANYKELGYIPNAMEAKLDRVLDLEKEHDYSLGGMSLRKTAATQVMTPNKGMIKDIKSLVQLANNIETKQDNLQKKQAKKNSVEAKLK